MDDIDTKQCLLCFEKKPYYSMYPCCGKQACVDCFTSDLTSGREHSCPFCRVPLRKDMKSVYFQIKENADMGKDWAQYQMYDIYHKNMRYKKTGEFLDISAPHVYVEPTFSEEKAVEYLRSSAKQGYVPAQYAVFQLSTSTSGLVTEDEARNMLTEASSAGYSYALYSMGGLHLDKGNKYGIPFSREKAKECFIRSEVSLAYIHLGFIYAEDKDFPKALHNIHKGLDLYKKNKNMLDEDLVERAHKALEVIDEYIRSYCGFCMKSELMKSRCGRCRAIFYCNTVCQKAHWKEHNKQCVSLSVYEEK